MGNELAQIPEVPKIVPVGDGAVNIEFGTEISDEINDRVYAFAETIDALSPPWLDELVPTYRSLLVHYDGQIFDFDVVDTELKKLVLESSAETSGSSVRSPLVYELPTAYGGEFGPDLESVAKHAGISTIEVVKIHSGTAYRVYMIGFSPGFPYLGGMDARIATPRLATPRTRVPAGSVGIAESQTGVYPTASPGGWQLIGRTPVRLFDHEKEPPSVLQPGHFVRFVPIEDERFPEIEREVTAGDYEISVSELSR